MCLNTKLFIDTCSGRPPADAMEKYQPRRPCRPTDKTAVEWSIDQRSGYLRSMQAYDIRTRTIRLSRVGRRGGLRRIVLLSSSHPASPAIRVFRLTSLKTSTRRRCSATNEC
jgi:hypothetical protein